MTLENIGLSLGNICESAVYGTLNGMKPKKKMDITHVHLIYVYQTFMVLLNV